MLKLFSGTFCNRFVVAVLLLFSFSCEEEKKAKEPISFKQFDNNGAAERFIEWNYEGIYIFLPECFQENTYYSFSATNEHNFGCRESQIYFSVDRFDLSDLSFYEDYFGEEGKSDKKREQEEIILDYMKQTRSNTLMIPKHSLTTTIETFQQKKMYLHSVKGKNNKYNNELLYLFGSIKLKNHIFLIQFIVNEEDVPFYYNDLIKVFKSIRHS